jgi:hypothetical protein
MSPIPYEHYMLSSDKMMPTFNPISHEQHPQI